MIKPQLARYIQSSPLMDVELSYGGKTYKFNLYVELKIHEEGINDLLKNQPKYYAFLSMLHKKLVKGAEDAEKNYQKVWASRYILYKTNKDTDYYKANYKFPSDDLSKAYVEQDKKYLKAYEEFNQAKLDRNTIETCVKAFEQRKDLIQSLSANIRNENK